VNQVFVLGGVSQEGATRKTRKRRFANERTWKKKAKKKPYSILGPLRKVPTATDPKQSSLDRRRRERRENIWSKRDKNEKDDQGQAKAFKGTPYKERHHRRSMKQRLFLGAR